MSEFLFAMYAEYIKYNIPKTNAGIGIGIHAIASAVGGKKDDGGEA